MATRQIIVVGGGAAGFFAAITCAETMPDATVSLLEKGPRFLTKVLISGGGRCNVTHACFDPVELTTRYPRGARALISPFTQFQARHCLAWFNARGVELKTEDDGRIFPVTDSSQTIVDCLIKAAQEARVNLLLNCAVDRIERIPKGGFDLTLSDGQTRHCDRLLLATGGCRAASLGHLAVSLGHTLEPPVPSLFTFQLPSSWPHQLPGVSVEKVEVSVPGTKLREQGPILITHRGLSGPAILRVSAWGARVLHDLNYDFTLQVNWLPNLNPESLARELDLRRSQNSARYLINTPIPPLPARLWEQLVLVAGVNKTTRWAELTRGARHALIQQLGRTELRVTGKSLNKDEFVTCGGVRLREVNFKTMESRRCPGLFLAGELLDIDGVTGGFNFQAAWTTGWIAGRAMATLT